ncbi:hypothetical protein M0805_000151 [Coniferiporia weirii]|nr:hypothetical protein M0805_000151 [Coniferiporia weirii]
MLARTRQSPSGLLRFFSSSSCRHGHISHIGRAPVPVPTSAVLTPSPTAITVQGPLGTTSVPLKPYIQLSFPQPNSLSVAVEDAKVKEQRQMWGTTRTLIHNAIIGMTEGFSVPVYLVGVGYRATLEDDPRGATEGNSGQRLNMKLGFSHSVLVPIPAHIKVEVPLPTKIMMSCTDKHLLGLFAAKVRKWRPPEPYKGKGIFVGNEQIRIKQVKKK